MGGTVSQYQSGTGTLVDFNTGVRNATLTGYVSSIGTVSATDNILQAIQKLNGNDALKAPLANPTFTGTVIVPNAVNANEAVNKGQLDAVIDSQIEISANSNTLDAWNGKTILFTANCTITVPAALLPQFGFVFRTLAGVTVTWAITAPFTWETTPTPTPEKTTGSFMRRGNTNTILLDF